MPKWKAMLMIHRRKDGKPLLQSAMDIGSEEERERERERENVADTKRKMKRDRGTLMITQYANQRKVKEW